MIPYIDLLFVIQNINFYQTAVHQIDNWMVQKLKKT